MGDDTVTAERRGGVLLIGIDIAERANALDPRAYAGLAAAFGELQSAGELSCGVLFARGRDFTSGLDVAAWTGAFRLPEGSVDPLEADEAQRVSKPVIIAVQGRCLAVGFELLLAADVRVAAPDAVFAFLRGQDFYPGGPSLRLPMEVGWDIANRFIEGAEMTADEGYSLGLINEVTRPGAHLERALVIADAIAREDPEAVRSRLIELRKARGGGLKRRLTTSFMREDPV